VSALGEGIVMLILIFITILFHLSLFSSFTRVIQYLPLGMADEIAQLRSPKPAYSAAAPINAHGAQDSLDGGVNYPDRGPSLEKERMVGGSSPMAGRKSLGNGKSEDYEMADRVNGNANGNGKENDSPRHNGEQKLDSHAFTNPAAYKPQPVVWLPKDTLGIAKIELESNRLSGIESSDQGAIMNEKGKVEISRPPPDEEWDDVEMRKQ